MEEDHNDDNDKEPKTHLDHQDHNYHQDYVPKTHCDHLGQITRMTLIKMIMCQRHLLIIITLADH